MPPRASKQQRTPSFAAHAASPAAPRTGAGTGTGAAAGADDLFATPQFAPPAPAQPTQQATGPRSAGIEQRRAPRTRRRSRAQLLLYPFGRHPHPIDVDVVDYSATGIGIIHSEGLLVGQKFIVREPHVTQRNTCLFTVVRSDLRADGTYSIGLHIGNTLSDELASLVEIPPAPGVSRTSKVLFVAFAILGTIAIAIVAVLNHGR